MLVKALGEGGAVQVLHDEEEDAFGGEAVVGDVDQQAVAQPGGRPRLLDEAQAVLLAGGVAGAEDLDRDLFVEAAIERLVDRREAPRPIWWRSS